MNFKILGALLIILSCGGIGFLKAVSYKKELNMLRHLDQCLLYMINELQYRQLPLPELCRNVAEQSDGMVERFFSYLAAEMDAQVLPNVRQCVYVAVNKLSNLPRSVAEILEIIGDNLGEFDLNGQINSLEWVESECKRLLEKRALDQDVKRRGYQTLGLCAGAALAILFT